LSAFEEGQEAGGGELELWGRRSGALSRAKGQVEVRYMGSLILDYQT